MKHRKNFRLVKVKTIIPSEYVKEICSCQGLSTRIINDSIIDIRKNSDEHTSLLQKDLVTSTNRLESLIEKVLYLSIISLVISTITLCIC